MIYNTTSSGEILSKMARDLNIADASFESKAIEWIGEAIELIGAGSSREEAHAILIVDDFKAPTPSLITNIRAIWKVGEESDVIEEEEGNLSFDPDQIANKANFRIRRHGDRIIDVNIHESLSSVEPPTIYQHETTKTNYKLNPGYFHFNFNRGLVHVAYDRIEVDENNYPTIPDSASYKEALFFYILKKLMMGGFRPALEEFTWEYANQMWRHYAAQAKARSNMPDDDEYKRFANNWANLAQRQYDTDYHMEGKYGNQRFDPTIGGND